MRGCCPRRSGSEVADFYQQMAGVAASLLSPTSAGGLGQGTIILTHSEPGPSPANPWEPVEPVVTTQTLRGAVKGVSQKLVGTEAGGTIILASDREAICAVPSIPYEAGDTLSVDGVPVHILSVEPIPAAGQPSAIRFILRS